MKQRISVEQLAELSPEQQERLREWWKPAVSDMVVECKTNKWYDMDETIICIKNTGEFIFSDNPDYMDCLYWEKKDDYLPKLTMGQCLQLIAEKSKRCNLPLKFIDGKVTTLVSGIGNIEPIDALFAAVKEVL